MTKRELGPDERVTTFRGRAMVKYVTQGQGLDHAILEDLGGGESLMLSGILPSCAMLPGGMAAECEFTIYVKAVRV